MKIQFIDSPTGEPFNLAYSAGQLVDLPKSVAEEVIAAKLAIKVSEKIRATKAELSEKRATVPSNNPANKRTPQPGRGKKPPKG